MGVALMVILAVKENLFLFLTFIKGVGAQSIGSANFAWIVVGPSFSVFLQSLNTAVSYSRNLTRHCEVKRHADYFKT